MKVLLLFFSILHLSSKMSLAERESSLVLMNKTTKVFSFTKNSLKLTSCTYLCIALICKNNQFVDNFLTKKELPKASFWFNKKVVLFFAIILIAINLIELLLLYLDQYYSEKEEDIKN